MGKRKREYSEDYIRKKIRKLEKKLDNKERNSTSTSQTLSSEREAPPATAPELVPELAMKDAAEEAVTTSPPIQDLSIEENDEDQLPEDFLLALGHEGEVKVEHGEAIRPELALRWTNIMNSGLEKEAREALLQKYPTPENFIRAVAPKLNPEIEASISELTMKRDKRIVIRQNMLGKIMSSLGKALSNLLKGDINSKKLIEQVNDAAKMAADVFHQDSASRKFFAVAGATPTVKEAVRTAITDELLFGKDCADKIRAAQAINKTGAQIKNTEVALAKKSVTNKMQGNWRGPPRFQQQQHRGMRGGHRQLPTPTRKTFNLPHRQKEQKRGHYKYRPSHRR